ncbi:hypothetical protein Tco_0682778 [Tanacetum coccineum]|uniref:Uncharacterized protein n=1 Tax=Tanacetum coccineum TaxID=301880 RepID=A0ABQ4XTI6_9ASTR
MSLVRLSKQGLRKLRSGGLGESNHMKAILVRESSDMEDELVILDGKNGLPSLESSLTIYCLYHRTVFGKTASASSIVNGDIEEITTTIDGKVKVLSEASIRRHLKLEDSDGISTLPTSEVLQGEGSTITVESHHTPISAQSTSQPPTSPPSIQITHVAEEDATMPHDSPLSRVHSLGSDEGIMTLNELTVLCTTLSKKVETLESDSKQTKLTYSAAYTKLIMKVKKLEHKIDEDEGITLVQMSAQTQGRHVHDFEEPDFEFITPEEDYTAEPDISSANVPVSTAGAEVSTASPEVKTAAESLVYIRRSAAKRKDKGKAIMKEVEPIGMDNIQAQIEADKELAHSYSSKIDAEQELNQECSKRQKIGEGSELTEESKDELSQEQLQQLMIIVPEEGMNVEDPLKWRLYDTCVVHHVSTERRHDIFMLVEKDYPLTRALMTLMLSNKLQVDEYSVMADELLMKIFILANLPRQ